MQYILDTNHCIYLINALKKQIQKRTYLEQNTYEVAQIMSEPLGVSEVTIGELYFGVFNSSRASENARHLEKWLKGGEI